MHVLRAGQWESPCAMASTAKAGYTLEKKVPLEVSSVCKPCFKSLSIDEVRRKYE